MSVAEFQRALAAMAARPAFAARVRHDGVAALDGFQLGPREAARLVAASRQRGMEVTCTLARANRFTPIAEAFPMTCRMLGPELRGVLDRCFQSNEADSYQLSGEEDAFARSLAGDIEAGRVAVRYLSDVLRYEASAYRLARDGRDAAASGALPPDGETVTFDHEPEALLTAVAAGRPPPELAPGSYAVHLTLEGHVLRAELLA